MKSPARFVDLWAAVWSLQERLSRPQTGPPGKLAIEWAVHQGARAAWQFVRDESGENTGRDHIPDVQHLVGTLQRAVGAVPSDLDFDIGSLAEALEETVPTARSRGAHPDFVLSLERAARAARRLQQDT